jgi:hypothetical protein
MENRDLKNIPSVPRYPRTTGGKLKEYTII